MSVSTLIIGKKEFVVVPRKRYEQLTQAEEDRIDLATVRKFRKQLRDGKLKMIPLEEARKQWGA